MTLRDYLNSQGNLPDFMKDFHDQKDLFKTIYDQFSEGNSKELLERVSWVDGHCFTVDIFLWWMGLHGYKLQKDKTKNIKFHDPLETIKGFTEIKKSKPLFNDQ